MNLIASTSFSTEKFFTGIGTGPTPFSCIRPPQNGWSPKNGITVVGHWNNIWSQGKLVHRCQLHANYLTISCEACKSILFPHLLRTWRPIMGVAWLPLHLVVSCLELSLTPIWCHIVTLISYPRTAKWTSEILWKGIFLKSNDGDIGKRLWLPQPEDLQL